MSPTAPSRAGHGRPAQTRHRPIPKVKHSPKSGRATSDADTDWLASTRRRRRPCEPRPSHRASAEDAAQVHEVLRSGGFLHMEHRPRCAEGIARLGRAFLQHARARSLCGEGDQTCLTTPRRDPTKILVMTRLFPITTAHIPPPPPSPKRPRAGTGGLAWGVSGLGGSRRARDGCREVGKKSRSSRRGEKPRTQDER